MLDTVNAFVPGPRARVPGRPGGSLGGLTFAVKDLFDVAGLPTGGGNHDWGKTNPVPERNAWAVQAVLDAGADLVGKTITDEVSLGILGENAFDGTPLNTAAPHRFEVFRGLSCSRSATGSPASALTVA
jgi:amidase